MKLNPMNLARHELIGLNVQVESNSEPGIVGLRGRIVDETRNTFLLETERKVLRIPKKNASLTFTLPEAGRYALYRYGPAGAEPGLADPKPDPLSSGDSR